jgi:hypothetical protein
VKTTITFDPDVYKLLQLASIEAGSDMSDIVNALIREKYSGWHIRKAGQGQRAPDTHTNPTPSDIDASGVPAVSSPSPVVRITGVTNRLNDIARRAHAPVDDAIDQLTSE